MSERTPDGSSPSEPEDQVMLAVLSNKGRYSVVLTRAEEQLLDDWVAGHLPMDAADRAAALTRRNVLAAERVLERRLLDAAQGSTPIPQMLTARIVAPASPPKTSSARSWWRSLGRRQWLGIAAVGALAGIAAIAVVPLLQQAMRGDNTMQVAMVSFADRTPLFESSDIRMRGGTPQQTPVDQRFRDIEIPTVLLRDLLGPAGPAQAAALRAVERYLPGTSASSNGPVHIIVDAALKGRIETSNGPSLATRIYDLADARSLDIRRLVGGLTDDVHAYLLTVKP